MKQVVYGWRTSEESDNALWAVFNGREAPFVPVAPLFVDSPFRGYVEDRLYGVWEREVEASGGGNGSLWTLKRTRAAASR